MNTSKRALMSDSQTAVAVLGDRTELDAIDAINVQFESRYNGRLSTDATHGLVSPGPAIRRKTTASSERPMNGSPWNVQHVISNHERRVAQHLVVR